MDRSAELRRLKALLANPPLLNFQSDMDAAESQIGMYLELRRARGVSSSEDLETSHGDLFWITRAAVVTSFSALDRLIHSLLKERLNQSAFEKVRYKTFQSASQIEKAMSLIGFTDIYHTVPKQYSKDLMTPDLLRANLDSYYDRKNLITHHADSDDGEKRLAFYPSYAHECCKFVREFGIALHAIVFGR